jgi:aryl-alcohol dehydrogenase-like predicted oxidoreductase
MLFRKLGNTDINLSTVGLGTYAIGGGDYKFGWGPQDDEDSINTIRHAVELGINWIDTAPLYGLGHGEEIVGRALEGINGTVFISTKCGLYMNETKDDFVYDLSRESIRKEIETSLRKLKVDVIDLYQLHRPFPEEQLEDAWHLMVDLIKEGKIRYAGVSEFSLKQLKKVQPIHPVAFLQPEYNMLCRSIEDEILGYCAANNIGIISYSSMANGMLSGKFSKERAENLPENDLRLLLDDFKEPFLSANLEFVEKLRSHANKNNKTVAQLAIAWVLRRQEVTSAIVGARNPLQIEQTVPAGDWVLSEEDNVQLDAILEEHHAKLEKLRTGNPDS